VSAPVFLVVSFLLLLRMGAMGRTCCLRFQLVFCSFHPSTDLPCLCTNAQFQVDALGCLTQHCPTEVQAALTLQQGQCAARTSILFQFFWIVADFLPVSITPTATATPTPRPVSFTSLGAASSTSPVSSSSSASKPSGSASAGGATGAGTTLHAGALPYFGAVLAGVLAL
jgi:hypothetical protein